MIPYIAVLILLIVVVLYQVYADSECFTDASGNKVVLPTTSDASGNEMRVSLTDLFALLGPFKMDASGNMVKTKDNSGNTIKASAPADTKPTTASTKEIEDRIAKAVSKQVKDDLMSQRATDDLHDKYAPCDLTDAEAQGQEYGSAKPQPTQPSNQPDMSEYIRKDSIPCWNCAVP